MSRTAPTSEDRATAQRVDECVDRAQRLRTTDPAAAADLCRHAWRMALSLDYQLGVARALLRLGACRTADGADVAPGADATEDPAALLRQSAALFQSLGDMAGESEALNLLANVHSQRSEHAQALDLYHRSLTLRQQLNDKAGTAGALNNIGIVLRDTGQYADALKYVFLSLEVAQDANDDRAIAYAQASIATLLAEVGESVAAMEYQVRALGIARDLGDASLECAALTGLGRLLTQTGEARDALGPLQRAHELAQRCSDPGLSGRTLLALGHASLAVHGADSDAQGLWQAALDCAHLHRLRRLEAETLLALARLHVNDTASGDTAVELLDEALRIATALAAETTAAEAHELLSIVHERAQRYPTALHHLREFQACQQRIHGQDAQRRIRALLSRSDMERAQHEVERQRRLNSGLAAELVAARRSDRQTQDLLAQLSQQTDLLKQLAREDGLTGLANRRWLDAQLVRERERARRYKHPLTVAMVDIDHFKQVNDKHSHSVGDEVLRRVARILRDSCRSGDVVARYGGEEFMLILTETPLANAALLCEKLRARIEAHPWPEAHAGLDRITVSIGLASNAEDPAAERIVEDADQQLYRAKREGRNRVCY